jgi:hypothetical protein
MSSEPTETSVNGGATGDVPVGPGDNPLRRGGGDKSESAPRLWLPAIGAAVVAGLLSWGLGEAVYDFYRPAKTKTNISGTINLVPSATGLAASELKNSALAFGSLGGSLGACLGFAGGLSRRSLRGAALAAALGLVLGSLAGVASCLGLVPFFQRNYDRERASLDLPLFTQCGITAAIGAAAGLALGSGLGRWKWVARCVVGGLIGGALGAAVYQLVGAVAFASDETFRPLSTSATSRLAARSLACVFTALVAVVATQLTSGRAKPRTGTPRPNAH